MEYPLDHPLYYSLIVDDCIRNQFSLRTTIKFHYERSNVKLLFYDRLIQEIRLNNHSEKEKHPFLLKRIIFFCYRQKYWNRFFDILKNLSSVLGVISLIVSVMISILIRFQKTNVENQLKQIQKTQDSIMEVIREMKK